MPISIEQRVRHELERELRIIERLRIDPSLLEPEYREQHEETIAGLDAVWERARDAVEALSHAHGDEAARYSAEFGSAWSLLKAELRRVVLA